MTKIQWTDRTWNPVRGCSRVSEGCRNCYAERLASRFAGDGPFGEDAPFYGFVSGGKWTGRVALMESKLAEPLRWRKPSRVFVNSMSDLFHESLPDEAIDRVFAVMALAPQHTFQVLTKRPERMRQYLSTPDRNRRIAAAMNLVGKVRDVDAWSFANERLDCGETFPLPNVWLGVSVEDQATADERIPELLATPAAVRFVSYEPALGMTRFERFLPADGFTLGNPEVYEKALDSGPVEKQPGGAWFMTVAEAQLAAVGGRLPRAWFPDRDLPARVYALHGSAGKLLSGPPDIVGARRLSEPVTVRRIDAHCLDWIIVGGESGPGARPFDIAWARSVVRQCKDAGVACFVKQLGANPVGGELDCDECDGSGRYLIDGKPLRCICADGRVLRDRKGSDPSEWPEGLRIREFPADRREA